MQVFKTFFRIAKKMLPSAGIYLVIFTLIMFLMSRFSSEDASTQFESSSLNITVIDEDHSEASKALTEHLDRYHDLEELRDTEPETLFDNLYYTRICYVLTIPEGYSERLAALDTKELVHSSKLNNSANGYFLDQQINEYFSTVTMYLSGGYSLQEALDKTEDSFAGQDSPRLIDFEGDAEDSVNGGMVYFFQYIPYIFLSVLILGMCPILITFHEKDRQNRIRCSALSQGSINLQLTLGCIVYTIGLWLIFLLGALAFYGPSDLFSTQGLLLIGNSAAFLPVSAGIALLLGTLINTSGMDNTKNVLSMVANIIGLGMSFLCGVFVPQYVLSDGVLAVAHFLPAYWYVRNSNMISGFSEEAFDYSTYGLCIGMQLIFFAALFAIYLVASKQRKQKQVS